jgi:hypothetical protein
LRPAISPADDCCVFQAALVGLEIASHLEAAAKQRMVEGGKHPKKGPHGRGDLKKKKRRDGEVNRQIGKTAGVSHAAVSKAKKVKDSSPALAADVAAGKISLNDAHKQVKRAASRSGGEAATD